MSLAQYIANNGGYRKLASRVGRAPQTLNNIARGVKGFDVDTGLAIKRETGISLDELAEPRRIFLEQRSAFADTG